MSQCPVASAIQKNATQNYIYWADSVFDIVRLARVCQGPDKD